MVNYVNILFNNINLGSYRYLSSIIVLLCFVNYDHSVS